jgi:AsmA family/AsmA-like C-terminal region
MSEGNESRRRSPRRALFLVLGTLLAAGVVLSLLPFNRYRADLAAAIGRSVGRQVSIGQITLSFIPQPGFDISDLVIDDDPRYGAEPVLRAASVHANLRFSSFWRGRLEIASLSLKGASLNLVRATDGSWNLERLLLQATQIPSAPTAKKQAESRPRFPYIEATESRINFKSGAEKKVFAFSDAEFALWLAAENRWNLRLRARPIRTDENLLDSGKISVSGSFDRARTIAETPFHLNVALEQAQLGELSRLIFGYDRGWHGGVEVSSELQGTPAKFSTRTEFAFSSLRRYDIARPDSLDLDLRCDSTYQKYVPEHSDRVAGPLDLQCVLPIGRGKLIAQGRVANLGEQPVVDLNFVANQVPLSGMVFILLHAKSALPSDLSADGVVNGNVSFTSPSAGATGGWKGILDVQNAVLHSKYLEPELNLGSFNISFDRAVAIPAPSLYTRRSVVRVVAQTPDDSIANVVPFDLDLGGSSEAQISGRFSRNAYELRVKGPASVQRLLQLARTTGVTNVAYDVNGHTHADIALYGNWKDFAPVQLKGRAELSKTVLPLKGISEPATIDAATLTFDPRQVQIQNLEAVFKKAKLALRGSITARNECPDRLLCDFQFALQTPELDSASLARLLTPSQTISLPFLSFRRSTPDWLLSIVGSGTLSAAHLRLKDLEAKNVSAQLVLEPNRTELKQIEGDLLGGHHVGNWTIEFASGKPFFAGSGTVQNLNMQLLSTALKETWGSGILDAEYRLTLNGKTSVELVDTAAGSASFAWHNGRLLSKSNTQDVLAFTEWSGRLMLRDGVIHLEDNHVHSASGIQRVSGTVKLSRESDLQFDTGKGAGFTLQGPLDSPSIVETPATTALGLHQ